jgi:hypothetical protein
MDTSNAEITPESLPDYRWKKCPCGREHGNGPRSGPRDTKRDSSCGRVHGADETVAVGRFRPGGPTGYKASPAVRPDAPLRRTRQEAEQDVCDELASSDKPGRRRDG